MKRKMSLIPLVLIQDQPVNDGWYSLTANWTVTAHGDTYSYNYILGTIYDIAALPSNN